MIFILWGILRRATTMHIIIITSSIIIDIAVEMQRASERTSCNSHVYRFNNIIDSHLHLHVYIHAYKI